MFSVGLGKRKGRILWGIGLYNLVLSKVEGDYRRPDGLIS